MLRAAARLVLALALVGCADSASDDEQAGEAPATSTTFTWPTDTVPWVEPTSLRTVDIPPGVAGALYPLNPSEVLSFGIPDSEVPFDRNWTWTVTDVEAGTTDVLDPPDFDGDAIEVGFDVRDGVGMLVARVCPEPVDDAWCHWSEGHLELWRLDPTSHTWTGLGSYTPAELTGDEQWVRAEYELYGRFDDEGFVVGLNDEREDVRPVRIAVDPTTGEHEQVELSNEGEPDKTCELADGTEVRIEQVEGWPLQTRRPGGEWITFPAVAPASQAPWCGTTTAFVLVHDRWVQVDADGNAVSETTIPGFYDEAGGPRWIGHHAIGEGTDHVALVMFLGPRFGDDPDGLEPVDIVIVSGGGEPLVHELRPEPSVSLPLNDREVRLPGGRIVMFAGTRYPVNQLLVAE